jgi:hypothetical protein
MAIPEARKERWSRLGAERVVGALAIAKRITDDRHPAGDEL